MAHVRFRYVKRVDNYGLTVLSYVSYVLGVLYSISAFSQPYLMNVLLYMPLTHVFSLMKASVILRIYLNLIFLNTNLHILRIMS